MSIYTAPPCTKEGAGTDRSRGRAAASGPGDPALLRLQDRPHAHTSSSTFNTSGRPSGSAIYPPAPRAAWGGTCAPVGTVATDIQWGVALRAPVQG